MKDPFHHCSEQEQSLLGVIVN